VSEHFRLRIRNSIDALVSANDAATEWLEARHVPSEPAFLATLSIEELVSNCIKYGYDDQGEHLIDLDIGLEADRLVITFTDDGRAFNPLEAPEPDLTLPLEERPIGGLGLHLLRTMSDEMTYERRDGLNRVTLVKALDAAS
jgi:anti-sigma regulatory factor (Ser/Thr protein kinase)